MTIQQAYAAGKAASPGTLLVFAMGDSYELFNDDAKVAARILGLTLMSTTRGDVKTPMCGFPRHQIDSYLQKLIRTGYRVSVVEHY